MLRIGGRRAMECGGCVPFGGLFDFALDISGFFLLLL
jgi:hypothetical protein